MGPNRSLVLGHIFAKNSVLVEADGAALGRGSWKGNELANELTTLGVRPHQGQGTNERSRRSSPLRPLSASPAPGSTQRAPASDHRIADKTPQRLSLLEAPGRYSSLLEAPGRYSSLLEAPVDLPTPQPSPSPTPQPSPSPTPQPQYQPRRPRRRRRSRARSRARQVDHGNAGRVGRQPR